VPDAATLLLPEEPRPVRLMNTIWADRDGLHDGFTSAVGVAAWLHGTDLLPAVPDVTSDEAARARRLRDAVRGLAAWATDDDRPIAQEAPATDEAIETINRTARTSAPTPLLRRDGGALRRELATEGSAVRAALGTVAVEAIELFTGELAPELRACHAPRCVLYFVRQHPRRAWCSPGCGNRARVARHYHRTHGSAG
jgi:predicted RNA-binding Zn ribbon-like protein